MIPKRTKQTDINHVNWLAGLLLPQPLVDSKYPVRSGG